MMFASGLRTRARHIASAASSGVFSVVDHDIAAPRLRLRADGSFGSGRGVSG